MSALFTHTPRAPWSPEDSTCAYQRYFISESDGPLNYEARGAQKNATVHTEATIRVYRASMRDHAEVAMRLMLGRHDAQLACHFTAPELREIAQRLLDAAHDIETHPAAVLMAATRAAAEAAEAVPA
jgi:hypothetical protein